MKTKTRSLLTAGCALWLALASVRTAEPAQAAVERVGVYASRIVPFAHFWSEPARQDRDALIASAKAAKTAGDTARFAALNAQLVAAQKRDHLQVFSTAPAEEAMVALKDKLPAIQKELGVVRLISKWDVAALTGVAEANRLEVTDRLAREFAPDEKRQKTIEQMKKAKPLPLDEARKLADAEKL
ncbi:MAG: hypothetical protein EXS32_02420 [Opitutus sp.]|nr:hypothetical protein [Opitutus sp.]